MTKQTQKEKCSSAGHQKTKNVCGQNSFLCNTRPGHCHQYTPVRVACGTVKLARRGAVQRTTSPFTRSAQYGYSQLRRCR